jgi:kinesin family protein 11
MNGSSRNPPARKPTGQGSMRPPARPATSLSARNAHLTSSPAPSLRSRAGTASPNQARRKAHDDEPSSEANINVVVRCRGRSEREKAENSAIVVSHPSTTEVALAMGPLASAENKIYTFDRTFGPEADQQRIYDNVVAPLLNEVRKKGRRGCGPMADPWDRCSMGIIVPSLRTARPEPERLIR